MVMPSFIDITAPVKSQSNLAVIIDKFREKVRAYRMINDAAFLLEAVEGARITQDLFLIQVRGELVVDSVGLPNIRLKFSGSGEYKQPERRVYLADFRLLNDMTGMANKLIEVTGIGIGKSLHVNDHDDALIQTLLV